MLKSSKMQKTKRSASSSIGISISLTVMLLNLFGCGRTGPLYPPELAEQHEQNPEQQEHYK